MKINDYEIGPYKDLAGADLTNANLANANLRCANLADANLRCANLTNANLADANLTNANLRCADLTNANLAGANLAGANLTNANLRFANLTGANLANANLTVSNLWDTGGNRNEVKSLQVDTYSVCYTSDILQIGCEKHTINDWWKFDDEIIISMDGKKALTWWKKWKPILRQIIELSPARPADQG